MKLRIEKAIYGGDGLAHGDDGKTVFVPGVLPGELVEVSLVEERRSFSQSRLDAILEASGERVTPTCEYVPRCGGCQYQHANAPYQLQMKLAVLRETLARAHVPVPEQIGVLAGPPWGYRNRIRLHAVHSALGYRRRGSHDLLAVSHCPIAAPLLEAAMAAIGGAGLEEVELFTNGEQLLVSLVGGELIPFAERLQARFPALAGVGLAGKSWGEPFLMYAVAGYEYRVSLGSFFQVNRFLLPELLQLVLERSGQGGVAWDLYAGVGLFAKALAYEQVTAVESAGPSAVDLHHNLKGKAHRVVRATTLEFLRRPVKGKPELVVVDPPRAGLGKEVCALLSKAGAGAMVYISCDPATLARDLQLLSRSYRVDTMHLVDLFPQTFHLETVAFLKRN